MDLKWAKCLHQHSKWVKWFLADDIKTTNQTICNLSSGNLVWHFAGTYVFKQTKISLILINHFIIPLSPVGQFRAQNVKTSSATQRTLFLSYVRVFFRPSMFALIFPIRCLLWTEERLLSANTHTNPMLAHKSRFRFKCPSIVNAKFICI